MCFALPTPPLRAGAGPIAAQDTFSEILCTTDPPHSVPGHGLGNRAAQLRHRTVCFTCSFLFRPVDPPPRGRGVLGNFATPTVPQDYVIFLLFGGVISPRPPSPRWWRYFGFSLFRRHVFAPLPLPIDMAVVFIDVFSPFRIGLLYFPFYLAFLVGFVASPFRGVGVGFEEPHLRHMF